MGNLQGFQNRSFLSIEIGRIRKIFKIIHSFIFVINSVCLKKKQSLFLLPNFLSICAHIYIERERVTPYATL